MENILRKLNANCCSDGKIFIPIKENKFIAYRHFELNATIQSKSYNELFGGNKDEDRTKKCTYTHKHTYSNNLNGLRAFWMLVIYWLFTIRQHNLGGLKSMLKNV